MTLKLLRRLALTTAVGTVCGLVVQASGQDFINTDAAALGTGISDDGSVVVGNANPLDLHGSRHAMTWTEAAGLQNLADIDRSSLFLLDAEDISGDGTVIIGTASHGVLDSDMVGNRAYRWTEAGGFLDLGSLDGSNNSVGYAVSADGNVVVGSSALQAMRWAAATGMESLGELDSEQAHAVAYGVSGDGTVIVGLSQTDAVVNRAFSWTSLEGMQALATLEGGSSQAFDVSHDGTVIVGSSQFETRQVAVRWVDGVVSALGQTERGSIAYGVSGNGKVIVGDIKPPYSYSGFRWDEDSGLISVEAWLRDSGVTIADGSTRTARATNCDGSVIIGEAPPPYVGALATTDLYIARGNGTGPSTCDYANAGGGEEGDEGGSGEDGGSPGGGNPGNGLITLTDLNNSLAGTGAASGATLAGIGTLLNGAGSRPLDRRAPAGRSILWSTGDIGHADHRAGEGGLALGEIGVGHNFGAFQLNGAIGVNGFSQSTMLGGQISVLAGYAKMEAMGHLYQTDLGGIWGIMTGTALLGEADVSRNYIANGGLTDSSSGTTSVNGFGLRGRLQWENMVQHISPFVEASHSRACLNGYVETGGSFPASFDRACDTATEARVGVDVKVPVTDEVRLIGTLEAVHRFESASNGVSGTVLGLGAFTVPGNTYQQNWLRAGIGVEAEFGDVTASVIGNVTTAGEAPSAWVAATARLTF